MAFRNHQDAVDYKRMWARTPYGFITRIYDNQTKLSRERKHPYPEWTRKELYVYAMNSPTFLKLFSEYAKSNYDRWLAPSFDRLNPDKPYTWDNIQIVTAHYNCNIKGRNEANRHTRKPVNQICLITGNILNTFPDATTAVKFLGRISRANIHACIYGRTSMAYGYRWEYADANG